MRAVPLAALLAAGALGAENPLVGRVVELDADALTVEDSAVEYYRFVVTPRTRFSRRGDEIARGMVQERDLVRVSWRAWGTLRIATTVDVVEREEPPPPR